MNQQQMRDLDRYLTTPPDDDDADEGLEMAFYKDVRQEIKGWTDEELAHTRALRKQAKANGYIPGSEESVRWAAAEAEIKSRRAKEEGKQTTVE